MSNSTHEKQQPAADQQSQSQGEVERDNDAHRPDGSAGTAHDSTAQKTARDEGKKPD